MGTEAFADALRVLDIGGFTYIGIECRGDSFQGPAKENFIIEKSIKKPPITSG